MTPNEIKKELAFFLLTDGGLSRLRTTYAIYFTNKSKQLHNEFKSLITQLTTSDQHFQVNVHKGVIRTYCFNSKLALELLQISPTYRTTPCRSHPLCARLRGVPERQPCIECKPVRGGYPSARFPPIRNIPRALQIIAATEGSLTFHPYQYPSYVALKRSVDIACEHPTLQIQIIDMLRRLGLFARKKGKGGLRLDGFGVEQFHRKIGFPNGITQNRGVFHGIEKQSILKLMIITKELIKHKQFFPGRITNLKELLRNCAMMIQKGFQEEAIRRLIRSSC